MSKSQTKIPSPARSQGTITPRRRTRRTLSSASPVQSEGRLSTVVEKFVKSDKFVLSPMKRRSVLPDDTEIEAPRRASWWKRLEGSSRDVLEALDTNKMADDMLLEDYEFEVEKDDKQSQSIQRSQSSDNESVASIVVPQIRLFNQKKQAQAKFGDIMGSRKSLGKTNIEDQSIEDAPKTLFNKGPRNRPVFPATLLNSTNKTINKTVEPETNKPTRPNLFGRAGTKRKNMFTDFVFSDSEEDSEVQHKVFGFNKNNNKRLSLGTRNRRMPSLTPSMTTEIDIDDWNLLPSSTMIGTQETSRISDIELELPQNENQDDTLTEENASLNCTNKRTPKSIIQNDENDKTLTNENIEEATKSQDMIKEVDEPNKVNETHDRSKTKLNESEKHKTSQNKSTKQASNLRRSENVEIEEVVQKQQGNTKDFGRLANNEQSLEDKMAELHGESVEKEDGLNLLPSRTENNPDISEHIHGKQDIEQSVMKQENQNISKKTNNFHRNEDVKDKTHEDLQESAHNTHQAEDIENISGKETVPNAEERENLPDDASKTNQEKEIDHLFENNKSEENLRASSEEEKNQDQPKEASKSNQDEYMDKSEDDVEPSVKEQESQNRSENASKTNQDDSEEEQEESEEEQEESEDEPEQIEEEQGQSEEEQEQIEEEQIQSEEEQEQSDEEQEPSVEEQESQNQPDEANKTNQDIDMDEKDTSNEAIDKDKQDEDMEEMVWNDNDDEEMASESAENKMDAKGEENNKNRPNQMNNDTNNRSIIKQNADESKHITNKSHKIVDPSVNNEPKEEEDEVVEETPNNSTHDTTGRNRRKDVSTVKSPEAVSQNVTNDNESFRPIGRSTTFRKSKSVYETMNMRHSLAPVPESTLGSEGSRNSSTEGSEWDSHRTTRKTIRQTLGKEYTTRKSLRALVMEQSAKRQTEIYNKNTSQFDKTKNKTVAEDGHDKNGSKIDKTKNKTAVEDTLSRSFLLRTGNKTAIEDAKSDNASKINKTKNRTVEHIRFRRASYRNSSPQSPILKSPVHRTSIHHVPDPIISEQISYQELCNVEDNANILIPENDSGPEISMNVSYSQGMSASGHEAEEISDVEMLDKENSTPKLEDISRRVASMRSKSIQSDQEVLDYEASEQVLSESEDQENLEQDESIHESVQSEKDSEPESDNEEIEPSEQEVESEQENEEEIEADSEHETQQEIEEEESQQELDEQEQSQQEMESEQEESQHEMEQESEEEQQSENESVHDMSQEVDQESDQEEPENESDHHISREVDQESDQEEPENESDHDISREVDQESDQEEPENESDHDISREVDQENDQEEPNESDHDLCQEVYQECEYNTRENKRGVSRIVFDTHMISVDEIDFEGVSRQTDVTEQSEREESRNDREEIIRGSVRVSEPSRVPDVSVGSKKAMVLLQMQEIHKQNMERRQKIREKVQKSLQPARSFNAKSPQPKYSVRRTNPTEPRKPKPKPRPTGILASALPSAFAEDLNYKPPKRFQPANASWITKRLYKFLERKLQPKYDYRARVRAEQLVQSLYSFCKLARRARSEAPPRAVLQLKNEMARLRVVRTHHDFYHFFHEFMPREIRIKVNPDIVNKIPMPRNGVFSDILQSRDDVE